MRVAAPFHILESVNRRPWALLTCEHASAELPPAATRALTKKMGRAPAQSLRHASAAPGPGADLGLAAHRFHDLHAAHLTARVAEVLACPAVLGGVSRLWIDLNRAPDDPELIPLDVDGVRIPFNQEMEPGERAERIARVHAPYHEAVDQVVRSYRDSLRAMVSIHTFTRSLGPGSGVRDFDVGILHDGSSPLSVQLRQVLCARGRAPRDNQPYSGFDGKIYSIARHGKNWSIPYVEVEICDDRVDCGMMDDLVWALRTIFAP